MNARRPTKSKKIRSQTHFRACQKRAFLLKNKTEMARTPLRGGKVFAFTSLFERWFLLTDSQAGDFLLRLNEGSRDPSHCGIEASEAQDTGSDKI
jgi:hypothetical protein